MARVASWRRRVWCASCCRGGGPVTFRSGGPPALTYAQREGCPRSGVGLGDDREQLSWTLGGGVKSEAGAENEVAGGRPGVGRLAKVRGAGDVSSTPRSRGGGAGRMGAPPLSFPRSPRLSSGVGAALGSARIRGQDSALEAPGRGWENGSGVHRAGPSLAKRPRHRQPLQSRVARPQRWGGLGPAHCPPHPPPPAPRGKASPGEGPGGVRASPPLSGRSLALPGAGGDPRGEGQRRGASPSQARPPLRPPLPPRAAAAPPSLRSRCLGVAG